jgi:ribosome-associated protein
MIKNKGLDSLNLSSIAIKGLQELKGQDIIRMDLRNTQGSVTDYFIICTGTSDKHVSSLAQSVMKFMEEEAGERSYSFEGMQKAEWVLIDYVNVVVHIFQREVRGFYRLEDLWGDAVFEKIDVLV